MNEYVGSQKSEMPKNSSVLLLGRTTQYLYSISTFSISHCMSGLSEWYACKVMDVEQKCIYQTRMLGSIVSCLFVFQYHTLISNFLSCTNVSCTS